MTTQTPTSSPEVPSSPEELINHRKKNTSRQNTAEGSKITRQSPISSQTTVTSSSDTASPERQGFSIDSLLEKRIEAEMRQTVTAPAILSPAGRIGAPMPHLPQGLFPLNFNFPANFLPPHVAALAANFAANAASNGVSGQLPNFAGLPGSFLARMPPSFGMLNPAFFAPPMLGSVPAPPSGSGGERNRVQNPSKPPPVKKYKCDVCGKAFSRSNTLITHKRIHTGEKPFKCEHCGRAFRQPGNLTRHRLTHTTVKPYICNQCGKAFNRASNLHTHMRTHSSYRPFVCPYCGKGFHQKIDMKIHIYTHTGDRPFRPSFQAIQ